MTTEKKSTFVKPFLWWGLGVVVLIGLYWLGIRLIYKSACFEPWLEPNEFGDMFGFLSCLFSGLAFAGLIVTIRQQRDDLELQRQELKRANDEAEAQTQQFEAQTKQFREQIELARHAQKLDTFYRRIAYINQQHADIVFFQKDTHTNKESICKGSVAVLCFANEIITYHADIERCLANGEDKETILKKFTPSPYWANVFVWARSFFDFAQDIIEENKKSKSNYTFLNILVNSLGPAEYDVLYAMNIVANELKIKHTLEILESLSITFKNAKSDKLFQQESFLFACEIIRNSLPPLTLPLSTLYSKKDQDINMSTTAISPED